MFNFKSKSWLDRFESQNSATVQAQAGLEIEVVDFSRGGVGHRETGRFMEVPKSWYPKSWMVYFMETAKNMDDWGFDWGYVP